MYRLDGVDGDLYSYAIAAVFGVDSRLLITVYEVFLQSD